jgi:hypothetical protein
LDYQKPINKYIAVAHLLPLDKLGKRRSSPIFLFQRLVLGQVLNQRNDLFHHQRMLALANNFTHIFIPHTNINRLRQLLYRIAQIILEMTLLALMSPPLVGFSLQRHVMQLKQTRSASTNNQIYQ